MPRNNNNRGGVRAQLGAALGNGNLSRNEALRISRSTGRDIETVMSRAVSQGGTLGRNLVNSYNAVDPSLDKYYSNNILKEGSPIMQQVRNAGTLDSGSVLSIGSRGSTQTVLPKSLVAGTGGSSTSAKTTSRTPGPYDSAFTDALTKPLSERVAANPNGPWSIQTLKDTGNYKPAATTDPDPDTKPDPEPQPTTPLPPPPEKMGTGGMSSDLDGAAKGFRRNKSKARRMGMTTKGASQFKISMAQGAKSGVNIGY